MTLTDIIPGVSQAKAIVGGIMVAGVLGFALWGVRVDHLRADHKETVEAVLDQLTAAGFKPATEKRAAADVLYLANAARTNGDSLKECIRNNDFLNGQAKKRADDYAQSTKDADAAAQDAAKAREALKVYQARMQGMAAKAEALGKCPMSADLRAEMEKFYAKP